MRPLCLVLLALPLLADGPGVIVSRHDSKNHPLTADPEAPHWKQVAPVIAENDQRGNPVPNHRTEIRSFWNDRYVHFLFTCPYRRLNLKPNPTSSEETNKLWEWDVAEVFIGADYKNIRHYREYQVSPQGEWVDLDIDRDHPLPEGGWKWNSGFQVMARIDEKNQVWYGEMKIPLRSITLHPVREGATMRVNFYRLQGPGPRRRMIAWQPTNADGYHVPEMFGTIVMGAKDGRDPRPKPPAASARLRRP
ncbi:MAG: carbohydrate-binding family 9-like protein [Bryobacter sp.]|nr:carbohydrate-binding family 9-like protein [Bryobacter sp.]